MRKILLIYTIFLFFSCTESNTQESTDCLGSDFNPYLITDIYADIEPALKSYGFELKETLDGGHILFVPYWGDIFKFSSAGGLEWNLSFNSKSLTQKKDQISYLRGSTPAFGNFKDKIYLFQSNQTINVYNLKGEEIANYSVSMPSDYIVDMEVIGDDEVFLCGTRYDGDKSIITFYKKDLGTASFETIKRIELDPQENQVFFEINKFRAKILIDRENNIIEIPFDNQEIKKINFKQAENRDYNKYEIPKDVDFISLPEEEQRKYRNDKTRKFNFRGDDLIIIHEIANRLKTGKPYDKLLSKHSISDGIVSEKKISINEIIDFDDCGHIFFIEEKNGDIYISKKTWDQID